MNENSKISRPRWLPATLLVLLLCSPSVTACCGSRGSARPDVVVVQAAELLVIKAGEAAPKDGWFVTEGWLLERLETEQALEAALERRESGRH